MESTVFTSVSTGPNQKQFSSLAALQIPTANVRVVCRIRPMNDKEKKAPVGEGSGGTAGG